MSKIDEDISEAVKSVAKAKVAEALGGDVISKIVAEVMSQKRDSYGRSDAKTWFDQVVFDCVQDVIRKEVASHITTDEMRLKIKTAIAEKADSMATTIVDAFATDNWNAKLEIKIER